MSIVSLDCDDCGVCLEKYGKTCRAAYLQVFAFGESFVLDSVHSVIRIRGVFMDFSDEVEVFGLSEDVLDVLWCLSES